MTIKTVLKDAYLKLKDLENPQLEAEVLLAALLNQNRTWLKTHSEQELGEKEHTQFNNWIQKRAQHIPTAYIIGWVKWNGLTLKVTPDTLIPRDETETLCHHISEQTLNPPDSILDVGTGSGCIACWAKTNFPKARITAIDISTSALEIAKTNAQNLELEIAFLNSDLLSKVEANSHFDLIIANLPYVPEVIKISPEVEAEPRKAIFSDNNGLSHIKRLAAEIEQKSIRYKNLWLEFLPTQADQIAEIFKNSNVQFFKAVSGEIFFAQIRPPS